MGAGGKTTQVDDAGADNVIRFPGNWFGSKDDLVPFGPAADRLEAEQAAARAAAEAQLAAEGCVGADAGLVPEDLAAALSADDFWGEGAEAVHQPINLGAAEPEAADTVDFEDPIDVAFDPVPVGRAAVAAGAGRHSPRLRELRGGLTRIPLRAVAVAALAVVVIVVAAVGLTGGGTAARTDAADTANADLAAGSVIAAGQGSAAVLSVSQAFVATRLREREAALAHKRLSAAKPAAKAKRKRGNAKAHRGVTHSSSTKSDTTSAPQTTASVADSSAVDDSEPAESSAASSASGPGGLGSAVGTNCAPVCS